MWCWDIDKTRRSHPRSYRQDGMAAQDLLRACWRLTASPRWMLKVFDASDSKNLLLVEVAGQGIVNICTRKKIEDKSEVGQPVCHTYWKWCYRSAKRENLSDLFILILMTPPYGSEENEKYWKKTSGTGQMQVYGLPWLNVEGCSHEKPIKEGTYLHLTGISNVIYIRKQARRFNIKLGLHV